MLVGMVRVMELRLLVVKVRGEAQRQCLLGLLLLLLLGWLLLGVVVLLACCWLLFMHNNKYIILSIPTLFLW